MEAKANSGSSIKGIIGAHSNNVVNNPAPFEGENNCDIPHQTAVDSFNIIIRVGEKKIPNSPSWPHPSSSIDNSRSSINSSKLFLTNNISGSINRKPTNSPNSNS